MNSNESTTPPASGEDVASITTDSPSPIQDFAKTRNDDADGRALAQLREIAALHELQELRDGMAARDAQIAAQQQTIEQLQAALEQPLPKRTRSRGVLSPRLGAADQTSRAHTIKDAALHASSTGKRRDVLAYLRLRRKSK